MTSVDSKAIDRLDKVSEFVTKIGFPGSVAIALICLTIWQVYNQRTVTDAVIKEYTKSTIEMTSAIQSLEKTSTQVGTSLKSLEMETTRRLDKIEMKMQPK